ncbi:hypothetical protein GIB67_002877 [Kingdonia uniflora]|uniref:ATPase AAA-type core domain-containing protein n=1 Tax=Kingdonia uniflora TaxID=39325 RepID=A0A7J7M2F6_9MAGN|nr:hypothetical protein GIB67_002877 [Kingdonia uniflora]
MKKSDGILTREVVPYNIVPLDAPALTNAIRTFAETPMFIKASEVGYNPIPNNLLVASTVSATDGSRRRRNVLTHEEQEAKATEVHSSNFDCIQIQEIGKEKLNELPGTLHLKSSHDANMSNIIRTPMFIEAREVESIPIRDNLSTYSSLSVTGGSQKLKHVLTSEEQEAKRLQTNTKQRANYAKTKLEGVEVSNSNCNKFSKIKINAANRKPYSKQCQKQTNNVLKSGGTNKEQCIDQNASVLLGTSCGINDTLNKGNAQFVLIMDTTLSDTGEPTIANDVFESLRYAANIDASVAIVATSTSTSDTCMLSITNNAFTNKCCMLPDVPMEDGISQTTIMNNISHNNLQLNTTTTKSSVTSSDQPLTNEPTMHNKPNPRNNRAIGHNSARNYLISLDMGALIAGAKFCGEFEDRLKVALKEVIDLEGQIILFIDEIHTVVGAEHALEALRKESSCVTITIEVDIRHTYTEYGLRIFNHKMQPPTFESIQHLQYLLSTPMLRPINSSDYGIPKLKQLPYDPCSGINSLKYVYKHIYCKAHPPTTITLPSDERTLQVTNPRPLNSSDCSTLKLKQLPCDP